MKQAQPDLSAPDDQFLRDKQVAKRYDTSVPSIWRWAREGRIPKPIKIAPGTSRWSLRELVASEAEK